MENEKIVTHTLIISDIHLGSKVSHADKVIEMLKKASFKKLILMGDIFESLDFERLKDSGWQLLAVIGEISKKKKVRWIEGNHDAGLTKIFAALTGAKAYKSYQWQYRKKKYLAIHGHQFDYFLVNNVFLSYLATAVYNFIQAIDFKDRRMTQFIKSKNKGWLRLSAQVADRALIYARLKGADVVFCGHTHRTDEKKRGRVHYYNSGCWTDSPCTFITLDEDKIEIRKIA